MLSNAPLGMESGIFLNKKRAWVSWCLVPGAWCLVPGCPGTAFTIFCQNADILWHSAWVEPIIYALDTGGFFAGE
jgi:hypothetical protein